MLHPNNLPCHKHQLNVWLWRKFIQQHFILMDKSMFNEISMNIRFSFFSMRLDLYRMFSGYIRTLAEQLDPNHQKLRIQKLYQRECPWPSAQAELRLINAYKVINYIKFFQLIAFISLDSSR